MNYRATTIFAQKVEGADFTETIPLNVTDPISMLNIQYQGLNAASDNVDATAHWAKAVTKIELVDGSDVLVSLDGMEAFGLAFPLLKNSVDDWLHYMGANYYVINLRIPFGMWLFDPVLALDPKRFNNLQLKVQATMAAGGIVPTSNKLLVHALCFDQKSVSPMGMLQTKEIKNYTVASGSHEYTDLPTDLKIRKLFIKALLAGTEPNQFVTHLKLSEDNDKRIPFDLDVDELCQLYPDDNMLIEEHFTANTNTTQKHRYCTPTSKVVAVLTTQAATAANYMSVIDGDGGLLHTIAYAAGYGNHYVRGFYPNGILTLPMGDEWDPADWFDPTQIKSLRLDLTGGAAGSAQIIVQQLRLY